MSADENRGSLLQNVSSNLALGLVNNLVLRVGNLLLGVVLARLLVPSDFGVYAVALTIQAVLANLTDLGLTAYLVRSSDIDRRAPTVLTIGAGVGVALALLMFATAGWLAGAMNSPEATDVIRALSLTLVLSGLGSVPIALLQRRFQQGRHLVADAASFVVGAGSAILMIQAGMGAMSLAWSRVLGQLVALVLLFVLSSYVPRPGWNTDEAREAYGFGKHLVGANVLSWVLLNMDYVLVGRAYGPAALGVYVLAFNIASWPTQALSQALRAVALPAFARVQELDRSRRSGVVVTTVALTMAAAAPMGALLGVLSSPLVLAVYGEKWAAAAAPLAALAAFGVIRPVLDLLATYLTAQARTRAVLFIQVAWTAALLPALLIGIDRAGATGAGLAHLVVCLVVVLPACLLALRRDGVSTIDMVVRSLPPMAAAVVAGLVAFGVRELGGPSWLTVVGGGAAASLIYLALMARWARRAIATLSSYQETLEPAGTGDQDAPVVEVPATATIGPEAFGRPSTDLVDVPRRPAPPVGDEDR